MPPVLDPRFSQSKWGEILDRDRAEADRAGRLAYVTPVVMLVVGTAGVMLFMAVAPPQEPESMSAVTLALLYPAFLAVKLVFGVAGLYVASRMGLDVGCEVGLAVVRLAGIYALTDLVAFATTPLLILGWLIRVVVYVGLLKWLFDLDTGDTILLAFLTWVLKVIAGVVILTAVLNAF